MLQHASGHLNLHRGRSASGDDGRWHTRRNPSRRHVDQKLAAGDEGLPSTLAIKATYSL